MSSHETQEKVLASAEKKGRGTDKHLGHLSTGDVVIPVGHMPEGVRELLAKHFDVDEFTVGHKKVKINPRTELQEFDAGEGFGGNDGFGGNEGFGGGSANDGGDGGGQGSDQGGGFDGGGGFFGGAMPDLGVDIGHNIGLGNGTSFGNDIAQGIGLGINDSYGIGPMQEVAQQNPSIWEQVKNFFSNPQPGQYAGDPYGVNAFQDAAGNGGLLDSNPLPVLQTPQVPSRVAPIVAPSRVGAPTAPDVPDTLPNIGSYYSTLAAGNSAAAANMLAPYLSGNRNVYGR